MKSGRKVIAIIPARGGSKRLLNKNILSLCGKPLIAWTVEAAVTSGIFNQVIINTDDKDIARVAEKFGATVPFIRPSFLAEDTSTSIDVLVHTLEWYENIGTHFTDVVLLQPTSPLRTSDDILKAWSLYANSNVDSVVSVCKVEHPIQWTYSLNESLIMRNLFSDNDKRSQDYEKHYRLNGAIYIASTKYVFENKKIFSNANSIAYVMSNEASVDIDTKFDFKVAEVFLRDAGHTKNY